MHFKVVRFIIVGVLFFWCAGSGQSAVLEVKEGVNAIVKVAPSGNATQFPDRLSPGTRVEQIGEVSRYYEIRLSDGRTGWSYKGNFSVVSDGNITTPAIPTEITEQSLLARSDVLRIIILDVEVGDATLIICPAENGVQDVLLIDTGENDGDRIKKELTDNGFSLSGKPIARFFITHYDHDHFGDAPELIPYSEITYDHGDNNIKTTDDMRDYLEATREPGVDRRQMSLSYQEMFSGNVNVECVAVNQATDFDPNISASSPDDNPNSIALLISFDDFDYFTAGDLTFDPEKSLAKGIKNCDVYHVDHHGSSTTSSDEDFVKKLDPEVSVVSNGTRHGHPRKVVAERLIAIGSKHYQTNINTDSKAYQPNPKYVADDTYFYDDDMEDLEGAKGTIRIVVDPVADKYFVLMQGLPINEATFNV